MSDTSGDDLFSDFFVGMVTIIGAIMAVIIVFNVGYFITQRYVNSDAYVAVEYVASFFIGFNEDGHMVFYRTDLEVNGDEV